MVPLSAEFLHFIGDNSIVVTSGNDIDKHANDNAGAAWDSWYMGLMVTLTMVAILLMAALMNIKQQQ